MRHSDWQDFYNTKKWKSTREAYARSKNFLCEKCLAKGIVKPYAVVHHKEHLNAHNVNDYRIALDFKNLECLCRECHAKEHYEIYKKKKRRYNVDKDGCLKIFL